MWNIAGLLKIEKREGLGLKCLGVQMCWVFWGFKGFWEVEGGLGGVGVEMCKGLSVLKF